MSNRTNIADLNKDNNKSVKKKPKPKPAPKPAPKPKLQTSAISPIKKMEEVAAEEQEIDIGEVKNPTITLMGKEYDLDSIVVISIVLFIWFLVWNNTGLIKLAQQDTTYLFIFIIFPMYMILNMTTSGLTSGGVIYELNILLSVEQMIAILFGTVVLFVLFMKNLPVGSEWHVTLYTIGVSMIILLCTASLWVNVVTSGRAFRMVRKFKQGIYNICLVLFIVLTVLFLKIQK
jgi:hypothetical protein